MQVTSQHLLAIKLLSVWFRIIRRSILGGCSQTDSLLPTRIAFRGNLLLHATYGMRPCAAGTSLLPVLREPPGIRSRVSAKFRILQAPAIRGMKWRENGFRRTWSVPRDLSGTGLFVPVFRSIETMEMTRHRGHLCLHLDHHRADQTPRVTEVVEVEVVWFQTSV